MYTPKDFENKELILDDRPYAGYMYLQMGIYQSFNKNLNSLQLQVGMIGPSTQMNNIQNLIHKIIGSPPPEGWEHQLEDELILQINYSKKVSMDISKRINLLPEYGFELGNASTKLFAGALLRYGWGIPLDYGTSDINNHNYNHIPLESKLQTQKGWAFCFNLSAKANLIAKDIFLDGNTFKESHSVDKKNFTVEGTYGFSLIYNQFSFDYIHKHLTKEFNTQEYPTSYGSILFSYNF